MPHKVPHYGEQIPDERFRKDLYPDPYGGLNIGVVSEPGPQASTSAYDLKQVHDWLRDIHDDQLQRIPVLDRGTQLQQGATYMDLADPQRREFTARGDRQAEAGNAYVAKDSVGYVLWNRLIGVSNPERLDQANER